MNNNHAVQSYLQHKDSDNHFANPFFQRFGSQQNVEQRGDTGDPGDPVYTQPLPDSPAPSFPIHGAITPLVTTTGNRLRCSIRPNSFLRWRERGRYLLRHIPYFMHCPLPHCAWRGNRADLFKSHWQQEDHCGYHMYYGRTPKSSQIETYDPWIILNQIKDGLISIHEGKKRANILVQKKASALQKTNIWVDA